TREDLLGGTQQSEQLMRAAQSVGPAARPLPLFYALSQATRAICVARLDKNYVLTAHGLEWPACEATPILAPDAPQDTLGPLLGLQRGFVR
ncbi:MAG: hypothetical protein WKF96_15415, partial [Solirubrobacteraceae bacterium]